jgi:hypothetical protein
MLGQEVALRSLQAHSSSSLVWRWHLQDFRIESGTFADGQLVATYRPRFFLPTYLHGRLLRGKAYPVTTVSSVRLGFMASIICAGLVLKKDRKNGEVIARSIEVACRRHLMYDSSSVVQVTANVKILRETSQDHLFRSAFSIGSNREHVGDTLLLYCKPDAAISYLN